MIVTLVAVLAGLIISTVALRWLARPLVDRSRPSLAVGVLTLGVLLNASSLLAVTGLLALAVVGRWSPVAGIGGWSPETLELTFPVPVLVGMLAVVGAGGRGGWTLWRTGGLLLLLRRSDRVSRRLRAGGPPVVFVDDVAADAFAVAGVRGCVVIGRTLFAGLDPVERQVLIAHEMSHLRRRHHLYVHAVDLAVTANPALAPVAAAVRLGVERWADEDAATVVCGGRMTVGRALARTALVQSALRRAAASPALGHSASVLCATSGDVPARARALMESSPRQRLWPIAGIVTMLVATGVLTVGALVRIHDGFERSEVQPCSRYASDSSWS